MAESPAPDWDKLYIQTRDKCPEAGLSLARLFTNAGMDFLEAENKTPTGKDYFIIRPPGRGPMLYLSVQRQRIKIEVVPLTLAELRECGLLAELRQSQYKWGYVYLRDDSDADALVETMRRALARLDGGGERRLVPPEAYEPTADETELERRAKLLEGVELAPPPGRTTPGRRSTTSTQFEREPAVVRYVRDVADGYCEQCGKAAPFVRDGRPFLEVHHVLPLADGGPDIIANAVAVCPNCHRAAHYADDAAQLTEDLYRRVDRLRRVEDVRG